jgi:hypothetical protein
MSSTIDKTECRKIAEDLETFFNRGLLALKPGLRASRPGIGINPEQDPINNPAFKEYLDVVKAVLLAYEEYRIGISQKLDDNDLLLLQKRLEEAVNKLNQLPTITGRFAVVIEPGIRKATKDEVRSGHATREYPFLPNPRRYKLYYEITAIDPDPDAVEKFGDRSVAAEVGIQIERLKKALALCKEKFPLGVCLYEHCHQIYLKNSLKQLYCSPQHASYARIQRHRERKKKQSGP